MLKIFYTYILLNLLLFIFILFMARDNFYKVVYNQWLFPRQDMNVRDAEGKNQTHVKKFYVRISL